MSKEERLTWDPVWPLPYESLWSVMTKVIVLNNLTLDGLANLIKCAELGRVRNYTINGACTEWIDFDRFGRLLRVEPYRLKQGCWDQIGLSVVEKASFIRICRECWHEHLYHCVFFDIASLSKCAWHQCSLTPPCGSCSSAATFTLRSRQDFPLSRFCASCYTLLPSASEIIEVPRMHEMRRKKLRADCNILLDWWDSLGSRFPARDHLLNDVLRCGPLENKQREFLGWQMHVACKIMPDAPFPWGFKTDLVPVSFAEIREPLRDSSSVDAIDPENFVRIQDEAGKSYRSLRNYLYKVYVRRHKSCYRKLLALNRDEALSLDGDGICLPALAFLIWRMSIEGVIVVEGLRTHRAQNYTLRLTTPSSPILSLSGRLRWAYFYFFSIWRDIMPSRENKFRVVLSDWQYRPDIYFKHASTSVGREDSVEESEIRVQLLYPDPRHLEKAGDLACADIKRHKKPLCALNEADTDRHWISTQDGFATRRCMFQVSCAQHFGTAGQFRYLNV